MAVPAPVPLLWTGGWDSTYRLLVLLLRLGARVEPWYLHDAARASSTMEMRAMDRMRDWLAMHHPRTRESLLPSRIVRLEELRPDADLEHAFTEVLRLRGLGDQYAYLSRFCRQFGLHEAELSLEKTIHGAHGILHPYVEPFIDSRGLANYHVMEEFLATPVGIVFGVYSLPMFEQEKLSTVQEVDRNGWREVMAMTWFCHAPRKNGEPCGFCNPCQYAIQDGFAWRIPARRRTLSQLYGKTLQPLRGKTRQILRHLRAHA